MYKIKDIKNNEIIYTPFGSALLQCHLIRKKFDKYKQKGGNIIKVENSSFEIIHEDDEYRVEIIIIGDKQRKCFSAIMDKDYDDMVEIRSFAYNKSCNTTKDMERVAGTKKMMKALIIYVKKYLSSVKKLILSDNAMVNPIINGYKTSYYLYDYCMLKYGEPHYVHNYGFDFCQNIDKKICEYNKNLIKNAKFDLNDNKLLENFYNVHDKIDMNKKMIDDFVNSIRKLSMGEFLETTHLNKYLYFSFIDYLIEYFINMKKNYNEKYKTQFGFCCELKIKD